MDGVKADMTSMLGTMTSWWGNPQPDVQTDSKTQNAEKPLDDKTDTPSQITESAVSKKDQQSDQNTDSSKTDKEPDKVMDINIEDMSAKAIESAKEWGTYLFAFGKTATGQVTEQVSKTAKALKDTIDEKTMIGDFQKEQGKWVAENAEKKKRSEASVAPWVGYNEEEAMKTQIMSLSADKRNFLRNPPAGVLFTFDFEASFPVASAMLQEDPDLIKMRFELVPKQVKEDVFWRNYFYRVSLIKQSAQLTSLAKQSQKGSTGDLKSATKKPDLSSTEKEEGSQEVRSKSTEEKEVEDFTMSSPPENEFASDAFTADISEEEIKKEMQQLGMSDKEEDMPEWEQELQAELRDYEVVNEDGDDLDDAELEQEILDQLAAETAAGN